MLSAAACWCGISVVGVVVIVVMARSLSRGSSVAFVAALCRVQPAPRGGGDLAGLAGRTRHSLPHLRLRPQRRLRGEKLPHDATIGGGTVAEQPGPVLLAPQQPRERLPHI